MKRALLITAAVVSLSGPVMAQFEDCSRTLIPSTVNLQLNEVEKLSLAWSLSEGAYNQAKKDAGASATIYGVPYSANYGEFRLLGFSKSNRIGR